MRCMSQQLAQMRPLAMSALAPLLEHKRTYADVGKSNGAGEIRRTGLTEYAGHPGLIRANLVTLTSPLLGFVGDELAERGRASRETAFRPNRQAAP